MYNSLSNCKFPLLEISCLLDIKKAAGSFPQPALCLFGVLIGVCWYVVLQIKKIGYIIVLGITGLFTANFFIECTSSSIMFLSE